MTARLNLDDHYIVPKPKTEDEKALWRAQLVDEALELEARAYGKRGEVALIDGDWTAASVWAEQMQRHALLRKARSQS